MSPNEGEWNEDSCSTFAFSGECALDLTDSLNGIIVIVFLMLGFMDLISSGVTTNKSQVKSAINKVINLKQ